MDDGREWVWRGGATRTCVREMKHVTKSNLLDDYLPYLKGQAQYSSGV